MITIGSVKVDIHKSERQYDLITFSDIECIKGLIKNRSVIDVYHNSDQDVYFDHAGNVRPINSEIICIFADLDRYISLANLNAKQKQVVDMLMEGHTEQDVAQLTHQTQQNVNATLTKVAKTIKEINDFQWKYEYIFLNHMKVTWEYKRCSKCNELKPALSDFFTPHKSSRDGLHSVCRDCR